MKQSSHMIIVIHVQPSQKQNNLARFIILIPNFSKQKKIQKKCYDSIQAEKISSTLYSEQEIQLIFSHILFQSPSIIRERILNSSTIQLFLVNFNPITLKTINYEVISKDQQEFVNNALFSQKFLSKNIMDNKLQENDHETPIYLDLDLQRFTTPFYSQFSKSNLYSKSKIIGHMDSNSNYNDPSIIYNCEMIQPDIVKFQIDSKDWASFLKYTKRFPEFPLSIYFPIKSEEQSLILKQQYFAKVLNIENETQDERWIYCELILPE